jgi:hypothetical protein
VIWDCLEPAQGRKETGGKDRAAGLRRVRTLPGHLSRNCGVALIACHLLSYSIAGTPVTADHTPGQGVMHCRRDLSPERTQGRES